MKASFRILRLALFGAAFLTALPARITAAVSPSRLVNLSVRTQAGGDEAAAFTVGFNLAGPGTTPLLVRGIRPGLATFGVAGVLADPTLRLAD